MIDRFEVTNGEYAEFLAATGRRGEEPRNWLGQPSPPPGREDHPVVWVTRPDAEAFAAWRGMRLPTELEWERAARGRAGYKYPWGNDWRALFANTVELELFDTTCVGTFESGRSPDGCYDMEGNVWEWTSYPGGLLKGGSAWTPRAQDRASWEEEEGEQRRGLRLDPGVRAVDRGFRCAADADAYVESILPLAAGANGAGRASLRRIAARWGPDAAPVLHAVADRRGVSSSQAREMAEAAEAATGAR